MTSQRALRRILQLFRLLSNGLSRALFHLVKYLPRLCLRFFTAKSSTTQCNFSSMPPTGPRVSGERGHLGLAGAPISAVLDGENTSYVGLPQNHVSISLNNNNSSGGASVSYPPMVATAVPTTEPYVRGLALAPETRAEPFGATDIDRYTGKPFMCFLFMSLNFAVD